MLLPSRPLFLVFPQPLRPDEQVLELSTCGILHGFSVEPNLIILEACHPCDAASLASGFQF